MCWVLNSNSFCIFSIVIYKAAKRIVISWSLEVERKQIQILKFSSEISEFRFSQFQKSEFFRPPFCHTKDQNQTRSLSIEITIFDTICKIPTKSKWFNKFFVVINKFIVWKNISPSLNDSIIQMEKCALKQNSRFSLSSTFNSAEKAEKRKKKKSEFCKCKFVKYQKFL